jgi:putative NADH-flavin reductase
MKVALIGASGCVGGFVVKHLLESGATVVLINRRHLKQYEGNPSVEQHVVDLGSITPNNLKVWMVLLSLSSSPLSLAHLFVVRIKQNDQPAPFVQFVAPLIAC